MVSVAVPKNPCEEEDMNPDDLHCLTCDGAETDEDCRESGVYINCEPEVCCLECHSHMNVYKRIATKTLHQYIHVFIS